MQNNNRPLLSIITVVFNAENSLRETFNSVFSQTFSDFEYVVIDGGSTDGTVDVIKENESKIDYWVSEKDRGIYDAMNKGLGVFRGRYVNFLNAGDTLCNESVLRSIFDDLSNDVDVLFGDHVAVNKNGKKRYRPSLAFNRDSLIKYGSRAINHQSMFVHRRVVVDYSEAYAIKGDLKWYFDMFRKHPDMLIKQYHIPVVYYDKHGMSETNKFKGLKEFVEIIFDESGVSGLLRSYMVIVKGIIQIIIYR